MGMADRIIVLAEGNGGVLNRKEFDQERIMSCAARTQSKGIDR